MSGWQLQARRVCPVIEMGRRISLLQLLQQCLSLGAGWQLAGLRANVIGPFGEPAFKRCLRLGLQRALAPAGVLVVDKVRRQLRRIAIVAGMAGRAGHTGSAPYGQARSPIQGRSG